MKYDRSKFVVHDDGSVMRCVCHPCGVCLALGPCKHCVRSCKIIMHYVNDDVHYLLDDD